MQIVLPATRPTPYVLALLGQGLLLALALAWSVRASRDTPPPAAPPSPAPSLPASPARPAAEEPPRRPGGLVELGQGRALLLAPDGRLIVLQADAFSGELRLERVYELTHDPDRHLGTPLRRAHGYYLEDVERGLGERVAAERARFDAVVADAAAGRAASLDDAEVSAAALLAAGGADQLLPMLEPPGPERRDAVRHHAATLALARGGYTLAVEALAGLLEQHGGSERLAPRLKRLLAQLTGLPELEPLPASEVVAAARAWAETHPPGQRPARVRVQEGS